MAAPKLTRAHVDRLIELGERGKSDKWIAQRLETEFGVRVSESAIHWHRIKHCAEPASRTNVPPVPTETRVEQRGDHVVRRFTQAEDSELLRLAAEGLTNTQIGKRLNRRPNSITGRLYTLSRHDERRERQIAQGKAEQGACANV